MLAPTYVWLIVTSPQRWVASFCRHGVAAGAGATPHSRYGAGCCERADTLELRVALSTLPGLAHHRPIEL